MGVSTELLHLVHPTEGEFHLRIEDERVTAHLRWPFDLSLDEFVEVNEDFPMDKWAKAVEDFHSNVTSTHEFRVDNSQGGRLVLTKRDGNAFVEVATGSFHASLSRSMELRLPEWPDWLAEI